MVQLPTPEPGRAAALAFVQRHFADVVCDEVAGSSLFTGGQSAADAALAGLDISGYASRRNEVFPVRRRGATMLSPYIRHGLISLPALWDHVSDGPARDVQKFRDELLWQEFARHWYARLGRQTRTGVRSELDGSREGHWAKGMACLDSVLTELHTNGWLVNQTRMWLASHWAIRSRFHWTDGEDEMFRHLLDGSRAANRLGWQWTTGVGSSKPYGFSRWQVEKRAPGLCGTCPQENQCPIQDWPADPDVRAVAANPRLKSNPDTYATTGPVTVVRHGSADAVWLTAESLGMGDPALLANPELEVVFVFDRPLLRRLRLSSKRLVFLTETLAEIGAVRDLTIALDDPGTHLGGASVATTFAPVPGFARLAAKIEPVEIHPWPWLRQPSSGPVTSFSAWRKSV